MMMTQGGEKMIGVYYIGILLAQRDKDFLKNTYQRKSL